MFFGLTVSYVVTLYQLGRDLFTFCGLSVLYYIFSPPPPTFPAHLIYFIRADSVMKLSPQIIWKLTRAEPPAMVARIASPQVVLLVGPPQTNPGLCGAEGMP